MDNLFSTHPATENRIAALQAMAQDFGGPVRCTASGEPPGALQTRASAPEGPWGGAGSAPAETAAPAAREQSVGPQSDRAAQRTQGSVVVSGTPPTRLRDPRRSKQTPSPESPQPAQAGLPARMAAARLLAAVVDARTPLDGMTDQDHGHPLFRALEPRDRALVRAILVTALRYRRTIEKLISARLRSPLPANATTLAHILHVGAAQILSSTYQTAPPSILRSPTPRPIRAPSVSPRSSMRCCAGFPATRRPIWPKHWLHDRGAGLVLQAPARYIRRGTRGKDIGSAPARIADRFYGEGRGSRALG